MSSQAAENLSSANHHDGPSAVGTCHLCTQLSHLSNAITYRIFWNVPGHTHLADFLLSLSPLPSSQPISLSPLPTLLSRKHDFLFLLFKNH